jgi:hypothetical protein
MRRDAHDCARPIVISHIGCDVHRQLLPRQRVSRLTHQEPFVYISNINFHQTNTLPFTLLQPIKILSVLLLGHFK